MDGQDSRTDEELIAQVGMGDEEAFRFLIQRHQDRVYGTVARMIGGAGPNTEDLAQQIFLRIWRAAPRFKPKAKFTTWLMTVTRNRVFTFLRTQSHKINQPDAMVDPDTGEIFSTEEEITTRTPNQELCAKELVQAVEVACAELPASQRMVLHLRQYEEMEYEDIAKVMEISTSSAKSLIFRARDSLRIKLFEYLSAPK